MNKEEERKNNENVVNAVGKILERHEKVPGENKYQ